MYSNDRALYAIWRQAGDNANALFLFFRCIGRMARDGTMRCGGMTLGEGMGGETGVL
jgi:hypothetical protein